MGTQFIIAGRRPLPTHAAAWEMALANEEGGLDVFEPAAFGYDPKAFELEVKRVVGFTPASVVCVRNAWELGEVVAEQLADALEGAVFCDADSAVFLDRAGTPALAPETLAELEERLRDAFDHPEPFFEKRREEERDSFSKQLATDESLAQDNDWSDIS